MTFLVVRDDDTLRDRLAESVHVERCTCGGAVHEDDHAIVDRVMAVLRDVGTPATSQWETSATGGSAIFTNRAAAERHAKAGGCSLYTRLVTDWTEAPPAETRAREAEAFLAQHNRRTAEGTL